jgi:hypothetical protein
MALRQQQLLNYQLDTLLACSSSSWKVVLQCMVVCAGLARTQSVTSWTPLPSRSVTLGVTSQTLTA